MSFETVSVIGLGYIGLPTAAMFAAYGKNVIGVDVSQNVVDTINRGEIHIVEAELDAIVHKVVADGKLKAVSIPEPADAFLIAVPTPFKGDNHEPDLQYIEAAAKAIATVLKKDDLVVLESTSPVGATEQMADWLALERPDLSFPQTHGEESDIRISHCPERVLPGQVVRELVENSRVIGGLTAKCSTESVALYKTFVQGECVITNARTAEMAKLTENTSRDVSIAFANELSIICDTLDINVWELISLANRHPRVNILQPGPGVGGHCIAVDPWFIVDSANGKAQMIEQARRTNNHKPDWVVGKVKEQVVKFEKEKGRVPTIACMGLAFKPDIDDLRESPALYIAQELGKDIDIKVVEPNIKAYKDLELIELKEGLGMDICIYLVAHNQFKGVNIKDDDLDFCGGVVSVIKK